MSWMDSWSRPSKHAITPPPLYLTAAGDDVPYCHSCGRLIGSRRTQSSQKVKYCSSRCRNSKPGPLDRKIEATFSSLLNGQIPSNIEQTPETQAVIEEIKEKQKKRKKVKGDSRVIVECSDVEHLIFHHPNDPEKVFGRKRNRAARGVKGMEEELEIVDTVDEGSAAPKAPSLTDGESLDLTVSDVSDASEDGATDGGVLLDSAEGYGGGKIRPPQDKSDVNGSIGGEKGWAERMQETEDMKAKRREGQRRAEEREMVRRAARRGCAFGFVVEGEKASEGKGSKKESQEAWEQRRKCEAVMKGAAVEASYAKGNWGIRWREKV
ncbi:uncharacterized protein EI97DRAFT_491729 [Westerdykella ornata]|uniref:Uncharacterized protein n=1 Tax=Westerdykella ornata TaxID=318751 RepID=A0A6A6JZ00_WESOR|nr:uncharacterized protein EI97DRAFT_491729 [Westerdykella ornata]KAF2280269.1 hypothetical protein EI97DRAFT_491729 [Westerdykella ornata]